MGYKKISPVAQLLVLLELLARNRWEWIFGKDGICDKLEENQM